MRRNFLDSPIRNEPDQGHSHQQRRGEPGVTEQGQGHGDEIRRQRDLTFGIAAYRAAALAGLVFPGFPRTAITHANIRIQQTRVVQRQWNLKNLLGSHENAHIAFTPQLGVIPDTH